MQCASYNSLCICSQNCTGLPKHELNIVRQYSRQVALSEVRQLRLGSQLPKETGLGNCVHALGAQPRLQASASERRPRRPGEPQPVGSVPAFTVGTVPTPHRAPPGTAMHCPVKQQQDRRLHRHRDSGTSDNGASSRTCRRRPGRRRRSCRRACRPTPARRPPHLARSMPGKTRVVCKPAAGLQARSLLAADRQQHPQAKASMRHEPPERWNSWSNEPQDVDRRRHRQLHTFRSPRAPGASGGSSHCTRCCRSAHVAAGDTCTHRSLNLHDTAPLLRGEHPAHIRRTIRIRHVWRALQPNSS